MQKPVWSVIDRPRHCIDRAGYLCENRLLSTPRKSLSHVRLNLLKLHALREWENETSGSLLKSMLLESIPALGFLLGPCDYSYSAKCVWKYMLNLVWCVCSYSYDALRAESRSECGIKTLKTSLGTSGCDWQEKKWSLCSGNWQQNLTQPSITQPSRVQYSTDLASTWGKKKTAGLFPFTPPYLSWLMAKSHNPTAKPLEAFFINTIQNSPIPSISI